MFNTICKKAFSVQPYARPRAKNNNTDTNLQRLVFGDQTVEPTLNFFFRPNQDGGRLKFSPEKKKSEWFKPTLCCFS